MPSLLRLTGWTAIAAAVVHLVQFLVLGFGPALSESEFPTPAEAGAGYWFGLVGALTFALIGLCYLVFFSAATELAWHGATGTTIVWRRAAQSAAVIGVTGWFLAGLHNLASRGFNATAIGDAAGDDAIARAALQSTSVFLSAAAIMATVVFCAWWFAFAIRGVHTRTIGWPTAIAVGALGGMVPLAGWVANVGGVPGVIIAFLVLGSVLLRKARRLQHSPTPSPSVVAQ